MSTDYRTMRAELVEKRVALTGIIDYLDVLIGDAPADTIAEKTKPAARHGRTDGRTEQGPRHLAARSRPSVPVIDASSDHVARIVGMLEQNGPMRPSSLAKALRVHRSLLTSWAKPLIKNGTIVATGATLSRQFSLPPRGRAAKEAP